MFSQVFASSNNTNNSLFAVQQEVDRVQAQDDFEELFRIPHSEATIDVLISEVLDDKPAELFDACLGKREPSMVSQEILADLDAMSMSDICGSYQGSDFEDWNQYHQQDTFLE